jgi:type III secretion system YscQ/HrcQ family protein
MALGIETPLAHTVVDRLLGYDRVFAGTRLQLTPVEWGVWTFLIVRGLETLSAGLTAAGPPRPDASARLEPGDLTLDRVGPDPFDPSGLGPIVTVRWAIQAGDVSAAARLWLPQEVVSLWLDSAMSRTAAATNGKPKVSPVSDESSPTRVPPGQLASFWRAEAGVVELKQGLGRLRIGSVLPLHESPLTGSPADLGGSVDLVLELDGAGGRVRIPARPTPSSAGRSLTVVGQINHEPRARLPIFAAVTQGVLMSSHSSSPSSPTSVTSDTAPPPDVPVTLTVELGRVNITLSRLADLKAGDVIELSRHSRAPIELTSNGRLVARGELILIDTDLGVRVTNVFL